MGNTYRYSLLSFILVEIKINTVRIHWHGATQSTDVNESEDADVPNKTTLQRVAPSYKHESSIKVNDGAITQSWRAMGRDVLTCVQCRRRSCYLHLTVPRFNWWTTRLIKTLQTWQVWYGKNSNAVGLSIRVCNRLFVFILF